MCFFWFVFLKGIPGVVAGVALAIPLPNKCGRAAAGFWPH